MIGSVIDSRSAATLLKTLAVDAFLVGGVCLLPALHAVAPWATALNPMLLLLLLGMTLAPGRWNALLLAIALPAFSSLAVGMPVPMKAVCMAAEFATLATLYGLTARRVHTAGGRFAALLAAVAGGKAVYYVLKALLLGSAGLVGTDWRMQAVSVLLWGGVFVAMEIVKGKRAVR